MILAHKIEMLEVREVARAHSREWTKMTVTQKKTLYSAGFHAGWWEANTTQLSTDGIARTWRINPAVHTLFAPQAHAERIRRSAVRESLPWVQSKADQ